jgi:aspartate aminotransferase
MKSSSDLCTFLMNHAHVSVVTGEAFGMAECFRISYSTSDERLKEGAKRIKKALGELK